MWPEYGILAVDFQLYDWVFCLFFWFPRVKNLSISFFSPCIPNALSILKCYFILPPSLLPKQILYLPNLFLLAQHVPLAPRVTAAMGLAWTLFGTLVGQDVYADTNCLEIFSLLRTECVNADPSAVVGFSWTSNLYLRNDLFHLCFGLAKTISQSSFHSWSVDAFLGVLSPFHSLWEVFRAGPSLCNPCIVQAFFCFKGTAVWLLHCFLPQLFKAIPEPGNFLTFQVAWLNKALLHFYVL